MPNKLNQKQGERAYFEMFRKHYPLPGTIRYWDKPDVILEGERKIGIEITDYYPKEGGLPESDQVQRKRREQVISEAQRIYQKGNGKKFRMLFSFKDANPIRDKRKLVEQIVALARDFENYLETGQENRSHIFWRYNNTFEPVLDYYDIPELLHVWIDFVDAEWWVDPSYNREFISMERLKEIIKEKEAKLTDYERCDAHWLLIVVEFWNPPQDVETRIDNCKKVESEGFEKIFVYGTFGHILELK